MNLKALKSLLKKYNLRPSKKLGQNFLIDKKALRKIIETAELQPNDIVLEIGPGIGNLTLELAKKVHPVKSGKGGAAKPQFNRVKKVIAVEKDPKMCEILKETLKNFNNVEVIQGDILKFLSLNSKFKARNSKQIQNSKFKIQNSYKLVANLPYYIVSPVIRKFLELPETRPRVMVLMVQKEVAQRICSKPPDMNLLAVSVQFYAKPEIISFVSKKSFWPSPKVDGAILRITQIHTDLKTDPRRFFKVVKAGFSQPRKQIANNLSKMLKLDKEEVKTWLLKNKISPSRRAETLSVKDWINLTSIFSF